MTDEEFEFWFAGFCDGEAHFNVTLATSTSGRIAGSPRFALGLREDDKPVLEEIHARLGVGKIRHCSHARQRALGKGDRDAVVLEVTGPSCAVVAHALDGKLRSKKAREFELWGPAVLASASMPRYDDRRAPMLIELRQKLMELRA